MASLVCAPSQPKAEVDSVDPRLADRLKRQAEKVESGADAVGHVGSAYDPTAALEPKLAERLRRQQEKEATSTSAIDLSLIHI